MRPKTVQEITYDLRKIQQILMQYRKAVELRINFQRMDCDDHIVLK